MAVRIGIIGLGVMGAAHLRMLDAKVPGAQVVAVSDVDVARARQIAGDGAEVLPVPLALIRSDGVDAVLIASSDATHADFVLACLEAGKPVLCEKPLAPTAAASLLVTRAEAAIGRRLVQVGFMRRFDPRYTALKRGLDDGRIGSPLLVHCAHRNASVPPSYTEEMLITSSAMHEFDVVRWLTGEEIVSATVFTPRPTSRAADGMRDPQLVVLETQGGVVVDVDVFANAGYGYDIRCELVGETGTLALEPAVTPGFLERFADAYAAELRDWVEALGDGRPTGPSAWDGYAATVVCDAGVEALEGRRVEVSLRDRPELYRAAGTVSPTGTD
jgi:myo-inositol 2-dehydrogenase / D-chiro-inositol 1-dehydrogenase